MMQKTLCAATLAVLAGVAFTPYASAQNIDKFVVSGDDAKKARSRSEISADTAEKITQACVNFAKEKKMQCRCSSSARRARSFTPIAWTARFPSTSKQRC
jgi:hypothetical protein